MSKRYEIVRFWAPGIGNRPRVVCRDLTLEEAQEHCNDPTTRKDGVYFDGYREQGEKEYFDE